MSDLALWSRLDALLDGALTRPQTERSGYLDLACQGNRPLRAKVQELLVLAEADEGDLRTGGALDGTMAGQMLDDLAGEPEDLPLPPGTVLGPFEVICFLGAGSVGRVYRARDSRLGREVAIKALAEPFRQDASALRRFEREARVLATVSHPNIAAIHGLEVIEGVPYLVLELVEGDTLEERLRRGPLPWPEAADVARQIAEALEEAHGKGVVHRDLKPSNVKLTDPGQVKVLDFGLARALPTAPRGPRPDEPPTVTTSRPGTVQGTPPYMSPEQARGLNVDARSDVWAFGCVLYEMLAGRRAFSGRTVTDVLAAVMRDDVDWTRLPPAAPPGLQRLLERCLRRDVRERLQHIGDARLELVELRREPPTAPVAVPPARRGRGRRMLVAAAAAAACLAAGAAGVLGYRETRGGAGGGRSLQVMLDPPAGIELAKDYTAPFAISPDGSTLAFLGAEPGGTQRLFVRALDRLEAQALPGTEGAIQPFFSPDGQWIAFFADRKLKKVPVSGGAPISVVETGGKPRGGSWGPDGTIVVARAQSSGLSRVSAEGGRLEELTRPDYLHLERSHRWPHWLPDGETVLFTVDHEGDNFGEATIEALSLRTGQRKLVLKGGSYARLLPGGNLVFASEGRLFAARFDAQSVSVVGKPAPVLGGVRYGIATGGTHVSLADDGTLVYVPGLPVFRERHLAWMDLAGQRTRFAGPPRQFREPRLSPRGDRVALTVGTSDQAEVWVQDVGSGTLSQVTFNLGGHRPIWTPDGRRLTVAAKAGDRWRLLSLPPEGGPATVLLERPHLIQPGDWSPDGRFLVYQELDAERGWDLLVLEIDESGRPLGPGQSIAATMAQETAARFSPDGRWLAFESDELDGVQNVYVVPFGRPGARVGVSNNVNAGGQGGRWPVWGGSGQLFYWVPAPADMRRVSWGEEAGAFKVRDNEPTWPRGLGPGLRVPNPLYDFEPAKGRFLFLDFPTSEGATPPYRMTLFVGWRDVVERRLAADQP